jgi:hypothetical protein
MENGWILLTRKTDRGCVTISAYWLAVLISGVLTFTIDVTNRFPPSFLLSLSLFVPFPPRAGAVELAAENGQSGGAGRGGGEIFYYLHREERTRVGGPFLRQEGEGSKENRKGWWCGVL